MSTILRALQQSRAVPVILLLTVLLLTFSGCDQSSRRIPVSALVADDAWQASNAGSWSSGENTNSQLYRISGIIKDRDDEKPVGNIVVELMQGDLKRLTTRSSSAGTFVFEQIPPGIYDVITNASSAYMPTHDVVNVMADGSVSPSELEILLDKAVENDLGEVLFSLNGEVRDERTGATLANEFIRLVDASDETIAAAQSDSLGKFVFARIVAGTYKIVAAQNSEKYLPFSVAVQVSENGSITPYPLLLLRLKTDEAIVVAGKLSLSTSQEPIGGMTISLYRGLNKLDETLSNGEGKFFFENLQAAVYSLKVSASERFEAADYVVTILSDGTVSPDFADIQLIAKPVSGTVYRIAGKILDAYSGSPLDFVTCSLREVGPIITDLGGNFYFENIAPGNYRMDLSKSGFSNQTINFALTDNGETIPASLTFRLVYNQEQGKGSIVGRVVDNTGAGVGGKYIRVYVLKFLGVVGNEKVWNLDPRPIKETRSNSTSPAGVDYSEIGAFKLTHLEPTSDDIKYLIYVGNNENDIAVTPEDVSIKMGDDVVFATLISEDVDSADRFYSWSEVNVFADTSTYLTNYEPHN